MNNSDAIRAALAADVPLLLMGSSGWGKSATVNAVAEELGFPVVTHCLAMSTPEDLGGIIRMDTGNKSYSYAPPDWVVEHQKRDKPFILFLDELNQAPVDTLHAAYRPVLNRVMAGVYLPNMMVIAAGNNVEENPNLQDVPPPLLKRFWVYDWKNDEKAALRYLNAKYAKYSLILKEIATNPRQTEMALKVWLAAGEGAREAVIALGGAALLQYLIGNSATEGDSLVASVELVKGMLRNGIPIPLHLSSLADEIMDHQ